MPGYPRQRTRRWVMQAAGGAAGGLLLTPIIAAAAPSAAGDKDDNDNKDKNDNDNKDGQRKKHGPKRGGPSLAAAVQGVKNARLLEELEEHHRLAGLLPVNLDPTAAGRVPTL